MGKLMDKVLGLMGFEMEEREEEPGWEERPRGQKGNVVSLPPPRPTRLVMIRPTGFEEAQGVADHLKARRPVVLNLEEVEREVARRLLDFTSGVTYALGGSMQKVNKDVFLCVPSNVEISGEGAEAFQPRYLPWAREQEAEQWKK